jgi:hypothetical protein
MCRICIRRKVSLEEGERDRSRDPTLPCFAMQRLASRRPTAKRPLEDQALDTTTALSGKQENKKYGVKRK